MLTLRILNSFKFIIYPRIQFNSKNNNNNNKCILLQHYLNYTPFTIMQEQSIHIHIHTSTSRHTSCMHFYQRLNKT